MDSIACVCCARLPALSTAALAPSDAACAIVAASATSVFACRRAVMRSSAFVAVSSIAAAIWLEVAAISRSEEHTSELQSLMRISYAVFCLKKKKHNQKQHTINQHSTNSHQPPVNQV